MKTTDVLNKAEKTIVKYSLIAEGDSIIAGFSGGPDSTVLLCLLRNISAKYRLKLNAVYVNHNLRPDEVPDEVEFCRNFCDGLDINFITKSVDVAEYAREHRMNRHEAARRLRYDALQDAASEVRAEKIALAHHADDQAETLLMRMVRGSGPAGLAGIPVKRGNIIRPLLEIKRDEIEAYLRQENISAVTDSSNLKQDYFRNMVRLSIMPALKKANPNLIHSLVHTMEILGEEERYFGIVVTKALMKLISRKTDDRIELFLLPMEAMEKVILRRVLRRAIAETEGLKGIEFVHIEAIINLVKEGRSGARLNLPGGIRVIKDYSLLIITSEEPKRISEYSLDLPGETAVAGAGLVITASMQEQPLPAGDDRSSVLLDAGKLKFPLLIRPRSKGDYFFPSGFGHKKKLQDFFVDMKVPRDERDAVPIVVSGDEIVWVAGYRSDERFRVTDQTNRFVRLSMVKGKF